MALVPALRRAVWRVDPQVPVTRIERLDDVLHRAAADARFVASLVGLLAALALGMAGIFGVVSWSVEARRRELGIRMALGATRRTVMASVVGEGVRLAVAGVAVGVGGALVLGRFLDGLLYGAGAGEPRILAAVALAMAAVAVASCWWPARRASRVAPAAALRVE